MLTEKPLRCFKVPLGFSWHSGACWIAGTGGVVPSTSGGAGHAIGGRSADPDAWPDQGRPMGTVPGARTAQPPSGVRLAGPPAAGVISGSDRFVGGTGAMDWRLFGIIPVMRAAGSDTSRSAAGRAAAEAVWVPTSLLPRFFGVEWTTPGAGQARAHHRVVDHQVDVDLAVTSTGLVRSVVFERWGDPYGTGTFGLHSFGGEFSDHATFNGMTIPVEGRLGWHYATDRWTEGEFFRFRVTDLEAVTDVHQ